MKNRSYFIFLGLLALSSSLIASTFIITNSLRQLKQGTGTISVKGCAEKRIYSDFVKWQGSLSVSAESPIQAYEKFEQDSKILQEFMQKQGIVLESVDYSPLTATIVYETNENGHLTNQIDKHTLSQEFSISSQDISQIANISKTISQLIKDGLSIYSSSPQYYYTQIDELKIEMLGEAAQDARQRAEQLVCNSGCRVGLLRTAHQGVFQITPAFSSNISDYGEYDTSSIEKRIKAVVTMEYAIN